LIFIVPPHSGHSRFAGMNFVLLLRDASTRVPP
jgi:hypothetical protein